MKKLFTLIFVFISIGYFAQYSTPGTGVVWNMDSLVANSDGIVSEPSTSLYQINAEIHISENDSLIIIDQLISVNPGVTIYIEGSIYIDGIGSIFSGIIGGNLPFGLRLEEGSNAFLRNVVFQYTGGIKVLTSNFHMESSMVLNHSPGINTGAAVEVSNGKPVFLDNQFSDNDLSAIGSAANAQVAPRIEGNVFQNNVMSNTNRPQINLGPSGDTDTTQIIGNTIIGNAINEMAGGIAFSSLVGGNGNVVIRNNNISDNRYGIAIIGNGLNALIDDNTIIANSIQDDPFLGGSGINLNGNGTSYAIISNNNIQNNHWGVTIQGTFLANLGDEINETPNSPGGNYFAENGNNGQTHALFNNTPNDVSALYNCWSDSSVVVTLEIAEGVISHEADDPTLGQVFYDPIGDCGFVGLEEFSLAEFVKLYPNPTQDNLRIMFPKELLLKSLSVIDFTGKITKRVSPNNLISDPLDVQYLSPGIYTIVMEFEKGVVVKKFVRE